MSYSGDGGEMRWLRLAATQGDAAAQFRLAIAYSFGRGVPEDDAEAARWYRLSAEQGYAAAQYHLGAAYAGGRGVGQDDVQAHMWFNLAASRAPREILRDMFRGNRDEVARTFLSPDQRAEAQRLAREWDEAHPR